jgi:type I restriction enzyme R subunit
MTKLATEQGSVQWPLIKHATDKKIGWTFINQEMALSLRRGEGGRFFYDELAHKLIELNPGLVTSDNVGQIIQSLESVPDAMEGNKEILEWLRGQKSIYDENEKRQRNVVLIDYKDISKNSFLITEEWAYQNGPKKGNRADVVFLINGIPVAIIENKNPKKRDGMEKAVTQLRRYELETPEMMVIPQVFNVTHLFEYFYGVTWNYTRKNIFNWKDELGHKEYEDCGDIVSFKKAVQTFFERATFLKFLKEWIVFYMKDDELSKSILRQHQTRAAEKVVERCLDPKKKSGLIWHTQGSGKTFTMITSARLILENAAAFGKPTVLLVIDRNELEGQMSGWVEKILGEQAGLDIKVEYATSKRRLQELFDSDFRGLIISMIHKFKELKKDSCTRDDIFVLIDEAHRSIGGDLGNYLMGALPKATLIGFTGTPIDKTAHGQGTFKTFGKEDQDGYLDKYSIRESIDDGTTLKLRHTLAPNNVRLPVDLLEKEFLNIKESEGLSDIEELNKILQRAVNLRAFLKASDRIDAVAKFIAKHFKENVEPLGYKAFLVAVDRESCALYKNALDRYLPKEYSQAIYTKGPNDVVDYPAIAKLQLSDDEEKAVRQSFPKPDKDPKIMIVTDKLLTGYDAPILYCMYLDKPMRDHVLLQAIARVNRPYEDNNGIKKPCGLIIDFVGILQELNKALSFDSDIVNGVIEDLDLLMAKFIQLMNGPAQSYLQKSNRGKDEQIEELIYKKLFNLEEREEFVDLYRNVETLYEILSPSPELRDYIDPYNALAEIYLLLKSAYGQRTTFYGEIAKKTEMLVREHGVIEGLDRLSRPIEIDEKTLKDIKSSKESDNTKIMNLVKGLDAAAQNHGDAKPFLISIAERANKVMDALSCRQDQTQKALEKLEALAQEKVDAEKEKDALGLDINTFTIYWLLKKDGFENPKAFAQEINEIYTRFPNYRVNLDELRQLKAEIYKILLKVIDGFKMVELTERILKLNRQ